MATRGRDVLLDVLRSEGVSHVFGNPGTTELPLMDALAAADDIHYVLGLQEATVVAMADGYAQATGRPAFANVHTSAGLGNAIGNLTNARANRSALVLTAGQQDYRHIVTDPLLAGPLVDLAHGAVKWAHELRTVDELATVLRRAFHDAASPPAGPVFVSLPMDLVEQETAVPAPGPSRIERAARAPAVEELAELLATTPVGELAIIVGDEVATSAAVPKAVALAETLGAAVYGTALHGRGVFPPTHPCWKGMLAPAAPAIAAELSRYRRVLAVTGQPFMTYPYLPGPILPEEVELLHVSSDPYQLGRTWPTRLGVVGDPRATLSALVDAVAPLVDRDAVAGALEVAGEARRAEVARLESEAEDRYGAAPIDPMAAAHALVRALPADSVVVDEAITTGVYVRGFHHWDEPGRYFCCSGGGLGWAMPAACGVSLAGGGRPVLCAVGDGSAMYSPQALWSAAHEGLPVVFAVVNNRQYKILKGSLAAMGGSSARTGRFVGMDIVEPDVDFVGLAASMGVAGTRVEHAGEIGGVVADAFAAGGPHLIEVPITA